MRKIALLFVLVIFNAFAQDSASDFRKFVSKIFKATDLSENLNLNSFHKSTLQEYFLKNPQLIDNFYQNRNLELLHNPSTLKELLELNGQQTKLKDFIANAIEERKKAILAAMYDHVETVRAITTKSGELERLIKLSNMEDVVDKEILEKLLNSKFIAKTNSLEQAVNNTDFDGVFSKTTNEMIDEMHGLERNEYLKLSETLDNAKFNEVSFKIEESLKNLDLSASPHLSNIKNANLIIPNKNMKVLAEALMQNYFDINMPQMTKRRIIQGILDLTPTEHLLRVEETVLKNTDILFQKSLQFFSSRTNNKEITRMGKLLKSDLNKLLDEDFEYILKKFYGDKFDDFSNIKQVAAATTGVGAIADYKGKKVFIKLQRPGLYKTLLKDSQRILELVGDSLEAQQVVKSITSGVIEEINLKAEAFNFELAKVLYESPDSNIKIPGILSDFEVQSNILIMEVAEGKAVSNINLSDLTDEDFLKLGKAYEESLEKWFEKSMRLNSDLADPVKKSKLSKLYSKYFKKVIDPVEAERLMSLFNGDLHGGNLFFSANPKSTKAFQMTWIDWGNAHSLNQFQVRGQVELMLGAINMNDKMIIDSIVYLMDVPDEKLPYLKQNINKFLDEARMYSLKPDQVMNRAIDAAMSSGIEPPESVINWVRGKGMLQFKMESDLNAELLNNRRHLITKNFKQFNTSKIYLKSITKNILRSIPLQIVSKKARQEAVLTMKSLTKFIGAFFQKVTTRYCKLDFYSRNKKIEIYKQTIE